MNKINKYAMSLALVCCMTCLLPAAPIRAQSISQLTTELILDYQKLAELKSILSDLYAGYTIIDKGYTTIKQISKGTFDLHKTFLDELLAVSPAVSNYPHVTDIVNTEYAIVSEYQSASHRWQTDGHFSPSELNHIGQTYSMLFTQSEQAVNELVMILTGNSLRASDADRMKSIDRIYGNITGQMSFLRQFDAGTSVLAAQRAKAEADIITIRGLYGIGN